MSCRKRTLDSTDLFLSNPSALASARQRSLLTSVFASPFIEHSAYQAHHSCVNALAISPGAGRWLASGGDDKRVMLHDALANDEGQGALGEPKACYRGAQSNIFAVDFDCFARKLYSAGNDAVIICHDLEVGAASGTLTSPASPSDVWIDNDDSVHGLACHPANPNLFLSASSDGTVRHYDTRADTNAVAIIADAHEMECVAYHPVQHDLFAYSGEDAHAGLLDARMAWSDSSPETLWRERTAREIAVVHWQANLVRRPVPSELRDRAPKSQRARPDASSVTFSPTGSLVALTLSGHLPTLYSMSSPSPLATCSASARPGLAPSNFPTAYRNACTTKHGSFGGGPDAREGQGLFYAAGSDDFGIYVWEIPSREAMQQGSRSASFGGGDWPEGAQNIGYLAPSTQTSSSIPSLTFPHVISEPSTILRSHRSIPNTTLYHPTLPYLYSCGVEKVIVRHSPSKNTASIPQTAESSWKFTPRTPRVGDISSWSTLLGPQDPSDELLPGETLAQRELRLREEDYEVLEYFDELIVGESDYEGVWRDAKVGEIDGVIGRITDNSEDEVHHSSDSGYRLSDAEEEAERIEGEGDAGTTRRILHSLYAIEEQDSSETAGDEEESEEDNEF